MATMSSFFARTVRTWLTPRPQRPAHRFLQIRPRLETLENRWLPAPLVQVGGVVTSVPLVHLYSLNGTLADQFGGPALTLVPFMNQTGTVGPTRYSFNPNQALQLTGGLINTSNYSIELVMQYSSLIPVWKKFIDFAQQTSDNGLYAHNANLALFPGADGAGAITPNTDFHVVLARNGTTGHTFVYLNGALQQDLTGTPSDAAVPPNNVLTFFADDTVTHLTEAQIGSADYIAIYNGPLSGADVTALYQSSITAPSSSVAVNEGQTASMSGTFHDPGAATVTVTASVGAITQSAGSQGTWAWSFLTDDGPTQSQTVTITATDSNGASSTTSFQLTVNNLAPTASMTNDGPANEGSTATVSFANQSDPSAADSATFHYAYDFDNDGVFDWGDGTYAGSVTASSATVPAAFLADGPGTRTVHGRILDKDGASYDCTTTITIDNVSPSVAADQATVTVNEGHTASNTGTVGDPGADTVTLAASVGTVLDNGNGTWSWSFPTNDGPDQSQTVTITATDSDGAVSTTTFDLIVNNLAPSVAADQATATVDEGQTASNTGTFGDPGADTVTLTASLGTLTPNGNGTWSWTYPTNDGPDQSQTVTITATDSDGAVSTTTFSLDVNNVAPSVAADQATVTVDEGQTASNTGTFGDPGADTVTLTASLGTLTPNGNGTWSWTFPTNDGPDQSQTVTITATDSDGAVSTTTFSLTVNNVSPTITSISSSTTSANPGQPGTPITVQGAFSDPGTADTHHAVIAWGDGTQSTLAENDAGMNQAANTFSASHTYAAAGAYTVTVTLADDDGGSAVGTTTATIRDTTSAAGTVTVRDGVLYVTGTAGADHVTINQQDSTQLKVHASFLTDGSFVTVSLTGLTMIVVDLGTGDNSFSIAGNISLPVIVIGGTANDDIPIGDCANRDGNLSAIAAVLRDWNTTATHTASAAAHALLSAIDDFCLDRITGSAGEDLFFTGCRDSWQRPNRGRHDGGK